jgi:hypothetical protein
VRDEADPRFPLRRELVLLPEVMQRSADVDRRLIRESDRDVRRSAKTACVKSPTTAAIFPAPAGIASRFDVYRIGSP